MQLKRVTITGADDLTPISELSMLSAQFPFVEWGILVSHSQTRTHNAPKNNPRWPSQAWMGELHNHISRSGQAMNLSLHLCGSGLRRLLAVGDMDIFRISPLWHYAQRVQFNFHGDAHDVNPTQFLGALRTEAKQYIFQMDGNAVNEQTSAWVISGSCVAAVPFYDRSHGAGVSPDRWPSPSMPAEYYGYAGGLGPDNVESEICRIAEAVGNIRVWIDMETNVRTEDDRFLDLAKVEKVLTICEPFIKK